MRVEALLGFARRVGALAVGSQAVTEAIRKGKAQLLLVSLDASSRTWEKHHASAVEKNIDIVRYGEKEQLGKILGHSGEVAVLAVTRVQFAKEILRLTAEKMDGGNGRCL
ncbi:MAG: 50S ribosomal protein L7ae [Firmicutes bacterium]|nr:50S ribosomal protein L7ae [Bacillota bacterium]HOB22166.1 ribosomal L7Ae/L30e/S12e/Gadd45 family protein [Bacillota bacterium]HQD40065.1 ribosomal L7Ae/L30e/S12e/Gadd45 family protein [Bacillota bacterium]